MESVYIESTIPSFLTARTSVNQKAMWKKRQTQIWWDKKRGLYRCYTSNFTLEEIQRGDPDAAARRLRVMSDIHELFLIDEIEPLANSLIRLLGIPEKAFIDAYHLAVTICHQLDFLLTWNCTHLANPEIQKCLFDYCRFNDLHMPILCTPADFILENES